MLTRKPVDGVFEGPFDGRQWSHLTVIPHHAQSQRSLATLPFAHGAIVSTPPRQLEDDRISVPRCRFGPADDSHEQLEIASAVSQRTDDAEDSFTTGVVRCHERVGNSLRGGAEPVGAHVSCWNPNRSTDWQVKRVRRSGVASVPSPINVGALTVCAETEW